VIAAGAALLVALIRFSAAYFAISDPDELLVRLLNGITVEAAATDTAHEDNSHDEDQADTIAEEPGPADHWSAILGVAPDAPFSEIRSAYHQKLKQYHSDLVEGAGLGPLLKDRAEEITKQLNAAYEAARMATNG
jgi:DnaJ-domain-containing protein 1